MACSWSSIAKRWRKVSITVTAARQAERSGALDRTAPSSETRYRGRATSAARPSRSPGWHWWRHDRHLNALARRYGPDAIRQGAQYDKSARTGRVLRATASRSASRRPSTTSSGEPPASQTEARNEATTASSLATTSGR